MPAITKNRNTPQSMPTQRHLRVEGQDGPWSVSVAETPNDAQSYTLYIKTPTHNLTLTRTAFEVVELDEKLHDSHPGVKLPKLPINLSSLPTPPKRKSAFLNTLSRLASPAGKSSSSKSVNFGKPPATTPPNGASSAISPSDSFPQEDNDHFGPVMAESQTLASPNNVTITKLAAYLTTIANDQIHRQTRVWKRFVRVRTDDLESVRVERAIKRVRSDLAAHLSHSSTDLSRPSLSMNGSELSKEDADTVIVEGTQIAVVEKKQPELPPSVSEEQLVNGSEDEPSSEAELTLPPVDTPSASEPEEDDDIGSTPVQTDSPASRIPRSQSADPTSRARMFKSSPLNGREETMSQTSATTGDESSVSASTTGRRTRKKRSRSEDPNRELKKRSTRKVIIDDFEMMRVLGKGCAGKVLLVRHKPTTDLFALKAITKRHVLAHQELQHTLTEQAVLKRMAAEGKDPFVVKLWWSFHDRENLFLVMDFHPGGDLATQLARWGRLGRDRARFYAAEIVEGVEGLHNNGVIYRDLKPENVLIGADGHIVLTDFGLSKEFPRRTTAVTAPSTPNGQRGDVNAAGISAPGSPELPNGWPAAHTETTTTFCGTAEYLAPEVIQGLPYSFEVDWWSFGTMLYEMLTGITPFWANNHSDMYLRVLQDELQFPEDRSMDQDTKSLIRGLLQRNPALRMKEPRVKKHPYFSMIDWSHVYYKRYIPPYIPPIDPSNASDTQNFDETFLDMEPVIKDENDAENEGTDTDQDQGGTDTDRTEGDDSVTTPSQSRSPSVHPQDDNVDVFDGYSFKGRNSILLDDDEDTSEYGDEEDEEDEEDVSIMKGSPEEVVKPEIDAPEPQVREVIFEETPEPKTPEARPASLPVEPLEPAAAEPVAPAPTKRPSVDIERPVAKEVEKVPPKRPSVDTERSVAKEAEKVPPKRPSVDTTRKEPDAVKPKKTESDTVKPKKTEPVAESSSQGSKPTVPPKAAVPRPNAAKLNGKRREKSGIAALDRHLTEAFENLVEEPERDDDEDDWDFVEAGDHEEKNGAKGNSLFARGVVDRYKLAVFRKSTPSARQTSRTASGASSTAASASETLESTEKQARGRAPGLTFRKQNFLKTPPSSFSSKASSKSKSTSHFSSSSKRTTTSATTANASSTPSLKSKQSAISMTSPSESSDQSLNGETTRPGPSGGSNDKLKQAQPVTPADKSKKKKYKGAEKVLSIFASPR